MLKSKTIYFNFTFFLFIFACSTLINCQFNTHQTIKKGVPIIFRIELEKHDEVKVNVFNTTGVVAIHYESTSKLVFKKAHEFCFAGNNVTLIFFSEYKDKGYIRIDVQAYEYSYEVTVNGTLFKKKENVVMDFLNEKFVYSKILRPKTYNILISYHSNTIPVIDAKLFGKSFSIHANKTNDIAVKINETISTYSIGIAYQRNKNASFEDNFFQVKVQLPNEMLKGCDGTNVYDSRIRACPPKSFEGKDSLQIHKIGQYPSFEVLQKTKTLIKITIIQINQWRLLLQELPLTLFIANSSDPSIFYNKTTTDLKSQYDKNQQCALPSSVCNFMFELQPGNYSVMPVILETLHAFAYLYERSEGDILVQSFYSVLPNMNPNDKFYYQMGVVIEFVSSFEKLTEITLEPQNSFFLFAYATFGKSKTLNIEGKYELEWVTTTVDNVYNSDPKKAMIYAQVQPHTTYLLLIEIVSEEKLRQANKQGKLKISDADWNDQLTEENSIEEDKEQDFEDKSISDDKVISDDLNITNDESFTNDDDPDIAENFFGIQTYDVYLETDTLQLSIRNGKFPHKKPQQLNLPNKNIDKNHYTVSESIVFSVGQNLILIIGAMGGIILLVILVIVVRKLKNKMGRENKERKVFVQQQLGSVDGKSAIGSNTNIDISQIISTQN